MGRHLFQSDRLALPFIETLLHYRAEQKYLLHEFVAMPDHVHVMLTPLEITIERAVGLIKGGFSFRVRALTTRELWQKGFTDHRVRDAADYAQHSDYIHMNPVRAKLCAAAHEYPYSSANGRFQLDAPPQRLKPLAMGATDRLG